MEFKNTPMKAMYDSLMAVLGGAAAGAVIIALPADDIVTIGVFVIMWLIVAIIGYMMLRETVKPTSD